MKKIIILVLLIAPIMSQAQQNSVKLTLSPGLVLTNNFGVNYERKITHGLSANLGLNLSAKGSVPFNGLATRFLGDMLDSAGVNSSIFNTKVVSYGLSLQIKYFPGKNSLEGFYIAPYVGYQTGHMKPFDFDFPDSSDPSIKHGGKVEANFSFIGAGLGIGNQWVMNNGLTLDILWLGLGAGANTFKLKGYDSSNGQVNYAQVDADVRQFLVDEKEIVDKIGATVTTSHSNSQIEIVGKHIFPYLKALNFSIGYSF